MSSYQPSLMLVASRPQGPQSQPAGKPAAEVGKPVSAESFFGDKAPSQGSLQNCFFLSVLNAAANSPKATESLLQSVRQTGESTYNVNRPDGSSVQVDVSKPTLEKGVKGAPGYVALEEAYNNFSGFDFKNGGFPTRVFNQLFKNKPELKAKIENLFAESKLVEDEKDRLLWENRPVISRAKNAVSLKDRLRQLFSKRSKDPNLLMVGSTPNLPKGALVLPAEYVAGVSGGASAKNPQQRSGGRVFMVDGNIPFTPRHAYAVMDVRPDPARQGQFLIDVQDPYGPASRGSQYRRTLTESQFYDAFQQVDVADLSGTGSHPPSEKDAVSKK
jgi:hypothetical protein